MAPPNNTSKVTNIKRTVGNLYMTILLPVGALCATLFRCSWKFTNVHNCVISVLFLPAVSLTVTHYPFAVGFWHGTLLEIAGFMKQQLCYLIYLLSHLHVYVLEEKWSSDFGVKLWWLNEILAVRKWVSYITQGRSN